jgi:nitrate reductase gamma subunit
MPDALRAGVILSALFAVVVLTALLFKTLSFGKRPLYSKASGSRFSGVVYAFSRGMMPWEKESARKHLRTYFAGVVYHVGIFAALVCLFCDVSSLTPPRGLLSVLRFLLVVGSASGLSLLLKRIFSNKLRKLSCPDDYAANAIVTLFVILAAVSAGQTGRVSAGAQPFYVVAILTFLYVPVGKIRHCFFFFYSRVLLGMFFGRRAALPSWRAR